MTRTPPNVDAATSPASSSAGDEKGAGFAAVLETLRQDQMPRLASRALAKPDHNVSDDLVVEEPLYGSYHILFPLKHSSDSKPRWLIKVPVNGVPSKWDQLSAEALSAEANTMKLLRRETTIPLPKVLDFSATTDNALSCPYILMTFITGQPLYDVWFGHHVKGQSKAAVHQHRTRVLQDISTAMVQLDKYSYPESGPPLFGSDGALIPLRTKSSRRIDHKAMLDRWFVHGDPDDTPVYVEAPTTKDTKAHYGFFIHLHSEEHPVQKGVAKLLLQFIDWIPEPISEYPFVLSHPDFDIQNFLVAEDGELLSIIDWDGIIATPQSVGNKRFPGWLTRDWDPIMYGYKESMEEGVEPDGVWEDSPATLAQYREIYSKMMRQHYAGSSAYDASTSQLSLIADNLAIAADDPRCRASILRNLLNEIWAVLGRNSDDEIDLTDLALKYSDNEQDEKEVELLRQGFLMLLAKKASNSQVGCYY